MKINWTWIAVAYFVMWGLFEIASTAFGQYSEIDHDTRAMYLGVNGVDDTQNTSATLVLPFDSKRANGWLGLFLQQGTTDGEVVSDIRNAHLETGIKTKRKGLTLNVFYDQTSDRERGIGKQRQIGGFVRQETQIKGREVTFGVGNFAEAESVRSDLELKDTDDVFLSRWLAYLSTTIGDIDILLRFTPAFDFRDQQLTLEPRYDYQLAKNLDLVVSSVVEVDSHPIVEGKHVSASYQIALSARW